jgi:hypothetical protein
MNTFTKWILACAGLALAFGASTPAARANLLVDPGFEANPLTTLSNVLNNFAAFQGTWGVEAATITGVDGGVTPPELIKMLRMVDDGLTTTQGVQVTDVSVYTPQINSGATVNLSALFTAGPNVPAAGAGVVVQFFSAANYGSQIGSPIIGSLTLDGFASTWQTVSVSGTIPVGTTWLVSQVYYGDASLLGNPGYVDAADLTIVPEPASVVGLLVVVATALRMRRR